MFFFFQAEDGIRDKLVTGVQTCALPISSLQRSGFVPIWWRCHSLIGPSTPYAPTTPSSTSRGNSTPEFWVTLHACCDREGWPFFASARWTGLDGAIS